MKPLAVTKHNRGGHAFQEDIATQSSIHPYIHHLYLPAFEDLVWGEDHKPIAVDIWRRGHGAGSQSIHITQTFTLTFGYCV